MKHIHKEKLQADLIKYSKQIGILDNEIPKLIFEYKEAIELNIRRGRNNCQYEKRHLGVCYTSQRTIFINAYMTTRENSNYKELQDILVHELVHYRFAIRKHTSKFYKRLKEILRGVEFESKHIHLFQYSRKFYTVLPDGTSESNIKRYEEKEQKRIAYNAKCREYWRLVNNIKEQTKILEDVKHPYAAELRECTENIINRTQCKSYGMDKSITEIQEYSDSLDRELKK